MAQYASEFPGEDFFDVDDPIDNINYSGLNNEDPDEANDTYPMGLMIPLSKSESSSKGKVKIAGSKKNERSETQAVGESSPLSADQISLTLLEICEEYGLLASKQMESALKRSQKHETVTRESVEWFVQGYLVCLTSHVMSQVGDNMNDMRKEIKVMQMTTASMSSKADVIMKAAAGLDEKIKEASDSVKEKFQESLENIERFVSDRIMAMSNIVESTIAETTLSKAAKEPLIVTPALSPDDLQVRAVPKQVIVVPDEVKLHPEIGKSAVESSASAEDPVAVRKTILATVGFTSIFIKQLSADVIIDIIPPNLYSEIKSMNMTSRIKSAVKSAILENLTAAAEKE
ncbi:Phosphoprotein [Alphacytorhabdovirus alphapogostemi]|uniref:Phosphoprotein n=1 Tax=Patchouli chlorosis-associated cytorhabdovirus TaxID=2979813 RepID=A0A977PLP5_9RHAB|nr:Phosphoprotein [Patchouli chlorosis-associated cytorhabdovirus]